MCVNAGFVPNSLPRLFTPRPARLRTEIPYEADVQDERAADREVDPENGTEVDGELRSFILMPLSTTQIGPIRGNHRFQLC